MEAESPNRCASVSEASARNADRSVAACAIPIASCWSVPESTASASTGSVPVPSTSPGPLLMYIITSPSLAAVPAVMARRSTEAHRRLPRMWSIGFQLTTRARSRSSPYLVDRRPRMSTLRLGYGDLRNRAMTRLVP